MSVTKQSSGVGAQFSYSIYPLQRANGGNEHPPMVPLVKGGTLSECLSWYLAESQQTGEVPIWCVAFIASDAQPLADGIMAAAAAFSNAQ